MLQRFKEDPKIRFWSRLWPRKTRRAAVIGVLALLLGVSVSGLQAQSAVDLAKLDTYFAQALDDWQVPGMAVAIVKDDQVILANGYGVLDINRGGKVDEHTLFAIASNSKAFNAAALAILVDEEKVAWDDRVVDHLEYFRLYDPFVTNEMRVRDLLSHSSGLGTYSGDLLWWNTSYTAEEVVRRTRHLQPWQPFRAGYEYSNLMFITAGEVTAAVSKMPWGDFIETRILDKLGMKRTVTSVRDLSGVSNVATPHRDLAGRNIILDWVVWDNMAAAGGIISSAHDMALWIRTQLNRGKLGGQRIFSEETSREMWSPQTIIPVSKSSEELYPSTHFRAYGLGWVLSDYLGYKMIGHGGAYDGMYSRVTLIPEKKLGIVILTNSQTSLQTALSYKTLGVLLQREDRDWSQEFLQRHKTSLARTKTRRAEAIGKQIPNTKPSLALTQYAGTYGGPMYGDAKVVLENNRLTVRFLPTPPLVGDLTHWHHDTFYVKWRKNFAWFDGGTVQFVLDATGKVQEMKFNVPNGDLWFDELEFKKK